VATGTAPLIVASTTAVANLNASLLGGNAETAFALLAGRSGGQTLIGGTGSGDDLTLQSTAHATKGKILFGTSAYDEVNNRLGIGTASPATPLHVVGQSTVTAQINFAPGSDTDIRILEVAVTGTPRIDWDESGDDFIFNKGIHLGDNDILRVGESGSGDGQFYHDGTNTFFQNNTGNFFIWNSAAGKSTLFYTDAAERGRITGSNLLWGATSAGASAAKVIAHGIGTAPSSSPADMYQQYAADAAGAGTCRAHWRDEAGNVVTTPNGTGTLILGDGVSGGQTLIGGTGSGDGLTLQSTAHVTKGKVLFGAAGATAYDEVNERLGVGIAAPDTTLHVHKASAGAVSANSEAVMAIEHNNHAAIHVITPDAKQGSVYFGSPSDQVGASFNWVYSSKLMTFATQVASSDGQIRFNTANNAEAVRIDQNRNVGIQATSFGTSASNTLALRIGTSPGSSPADIFQIHAADTVAGQANCYMRNEEGKSEQITGLKVRVSSQFDKTNATLANITGLSRNVEAGKSYAFRAVLHFAATAGGGHKYAMGGTATATAVIYEILSIGNATSAFRITSRQTALGGYAGNAGSVAGITIIEGHITVNTAGTLVPQFAQNAASGTSSILVGSTFELIPIGS